jgi:deoxyribonuclease-4
MTAKVVYDVDDEIGAHVSNGKGIHNAPSRARERGTSVLQLFTKQAQRWADPVFDTATIAAFRAESQAHRIDVRTSHDSYLINLASPDPVLRKRSIESFVAELERCNALGIEMLVTHPGNATDGDLASGMDRNGDGLLEAMETAGGDTLVLLETTSGSGTSVGRTFEQLATIIARAEPLRARFGICMDTCHVWSAGYNVCDEFDGVMAHFDDVLGLDTLKLFHLNDSATPFASRRDRHADIGEGSMGDGPFRRIVTDDRFLRVPKVIETPKIPDVLSADLRNIERLRSYR